MQVYYLVVYVNSMAHQLFSTECLINVFQFVNQTKLLFYANESINHYLFVVSKYTDVALHAK